MVPSLIGSTRLTKAPRRRSAFICSGLGIGSWLSLDEGGNLILSMQVVAVGAMAIAAATIALAFGDEAWKHLAESASAADDPAADQAQVEHHS